MKVLENFRLVILCRKIYVSLHHVLQKVKQHFKNTTADTESLQFLMSILKVKLQNVLIFSSAPCECLQGLML
jgi:hypothetical protein